ncbi:glycosyltransferase family 4 protein [Salinibacillus xinjiangensis]|uniref:Glycosyltransferase n=1 Tax=Salinibacillus xinjiangensis TaxID=1229268 RepID=A0A6G1X2N2_9BACI|nr:glycosyltransferase family 4 protein [Salinibacillus xinjiangensis]MRG85088.1 glycosyltransferase [Salinibacillus xinjiangensis]
MAKSLLILTQNFYPVIGSAGNRMKNIFELLSQKNINVDVLTTEPAYPNRNLYKQEEFWDEEHLNQNPNIIRLLLRSKKRKSQLLSLLTFYLEMGFKFIKKIFQLRKEKYDYIYVSSPPIFIVLSAFIAKRLFKAKIILEVRDLWPDSLSGVKKFDNKLIIGTFRFLEKKMYNHADEVIINSLGFKPHIKKMLKDQNKSITYLPNGARMKEIGSVGSKNKDFFQVVYAGNLGLAQDVDKIKELAFKLNEKKIVFQVIGYGLKAQEFSQFIERNDLQYVKLNKPTTRKKSLEIIAQSHLSVTFLNDEEVFATVLPGKVLDYATCQTPVIAGVKGQAADIINKYKIGYVFENTAIEEMINKILELKEEDNMRSELEQNCKELIQTQFLWEKNIEEIMPLLSE